MKRIKGFRLFESAGVDLEKVCALYEDVRSIGYLLEEEGIPVEYRLRLVSIGRRGSLQKEVVSVRINNSDDIRRALAIDSLREFVIFVKNPEPKNPPYALRLRNNNGVELSVQEVEFREEFERYYSILAEHLDYVDSSFIDRVVSRPPLTFEVRVAADFFM
jgi:hypothetical protein